MSKAVMPPPGGYAHVEFLSNDPDATRRFYAAVFGWTFEDLPELDYSLYRSANLSGGLVRPGEDMPGPRVLTYIRVDDLDAALGKVLAAGGEVLRPKEEVPSYGAWALFRAPGGIVQALWQAAAAPPKERAKRRPKAKRAARAR